MIERHTLKNGLRIIGQKNKDSLATSVLVLVRTGSRNEPLKLHGISHFLEHMCFKGTKKRPTFQDIAKEIDSMGAFNNAFTGKEYTGYYIKADNSHFEKCLDILSDITFNSEFDEKEIEKEKGTLLEEINMYEDDPSTNVYLLFDNIIDKNTLVAQSSLGEKEPIKSLSKSILKNYRDSYYKAGNSIVSCVGNLPDDYIQKIEKYFGQVEGGDKTFMESVSNPLYEKRVLLKTKDTEQSHVILGVESFDIHHKERYAVDLLSVILGGNASSRLFAEVREKRGLAYFVHSMTDRGFDNGAFLIKAGLNTDKIEDAIRIIMKEMEKIKSDVKEEELERAKEYIKGSLALSEENSLVVAEKNALEDILGNKSLLLTERIKLYEKVTLADIQRMANEIFDASKMKLAIIGPYENEDKFVKILES